MNKKIVMLVGNDHSSYYIYNSLLAEFEISAVILEDMPDRKAFLKRRIKRLGLPKVLGQVMFRILIVPFLNFEVRSRIQELIEKNKLMNTDFKEEHLIRVPSVNSQECMDLLKKIQPEVVIVQGTRIISKKVLNCINATFINTHAGITPLYRGIHGAYWSKINNDGHCGVSVHLVDPGIDTGGILYQDTIETIPEDNFVSYTYLQLAKGIELMKLAISDALENKTKVITNDLESKFRTHPTIWFYLKNRWLKGVK